MDDHLGGFSIAGDNDVLKQANQTAGTSFKFLNFDRSSVPTPLGTNFKNDSQLSHYNEDQKRRKLDS